MDTTLIQYLLFQLRPLKFFMKIDERIVNVYIYERLR